MKSTYETILSWFVGHDEMRPQLTTPFSNEDYYFATDAHKLIAIPKSLIILDIDRDEYSLHKKSVEMINGRRYESHPINTQTALGVFNDHINLIDELDRSRVTECGKCQGEGKVECPCCGHVSDCPDCDGNGETGIVTKTGEKIPDPEQRFLINKIKFKSCNILPIFNVAELLKIDTINWAISQSESFNVFEIGEIKLICMPMMQHYEDDKGTVISL